jgi:hypothetical protein
MSWMDVDAIPNPHEREWDDEERGEFYRMETEQITALVTVEQLTPMQLFAPGALNPILERIKAEVRAIETDISTEAGRKAIASTAYKIARTKTFIDEQRVQLVGDEKKRLAAIDAEGRRVREELDALKDEFRKPLTDWEDLESRRMAEHWRRIATMDDVARATFLSIDNLERASVVLDQTWDHNFQEFTKRATQEHEKAVLNLQSERKRIQQAESERIERERLRAEEQEKARIERESKIAEDARLKAEAEASRREQALALAAKQREEEAARIAAEDKARLEREKAEAAAEFKRREEEAAREHEREKAVASEATLRAKLAAEERERQEQADRIAARERAEAERESAVRAERKRQEDIRQAEEDQRAAVEAERARREADRAHRQRIHADIFTALVAQVPELTAPCARLVIQAIAKNLIPSVSINY